MADEKMTADEAVEEGKRLHQAGKLSEAEAVYRRILETTPDHAESIHFLGVLALQRGDARAAADLLIRADQLRPGNGGYLSNLGVALMQLERFAEAESVLRRATAARPDLATAFGNLGAACKQLGKFDEATAAFERALALNPRAADAHYGLGGVLFETGSAREAIAHLSTALEIDPSLAGIDSARLFMMGTVPGMDAGAILREARAWNLRHAALSKSSNDFSNPRDPEKRLHIGYVSGDFREHSVGRFMQPLLPNHDRAVVKIFCYSNAKHEDAMTLRLRSVSDEWRDITGVSDERVEEMIRCDAIDVLVDLSMHTGENRMPLFTRRPAPVQATYLAYCGTTGVAAIDYRLSDAQLDPPGMDESVYSEKTLRLPGCYWCYEANAKAGESAALPAPGNRAVTFGSVNNFFKVNDEVLAAWKEILQAVPGSRLILVAPEGRHRRRVIELLGDRVEFSPRMTLEEYFRLLRRIDVALDTFPYAGGTTTCDALWMGVPVVTLEGKTGLGRGGVSILTCVGASELVAGDVKSYVRIASELAGDARRMATYRGSLREKMRSSVLMDAKNFVRGMEAAYRRMWREWCAR